MEVLMLKKENEQLRRFVSCWRVRSIDCLKSQVGICLRLVTRALSPRWRAGNALRMWALEQHLGQMQKYQATIDYLT